MGYTKKDKILADILFPETPNEDVVVVPSYPDVGYYVAYEDEEYIADTYQDLIDFIVESFEPGGYDIYYLEGDKKTFYASFTFQASDRNRFK